MLVHIPIGRIKLEGALDIPDNSKSIVVFAHGSGSSRHSVRNNYVAKILREAGFATLLMDLLSEEEDMSYEIRFDIDLLSERLIEACHWLKTRDDTKSLKIGLFGASTGAAASLTAAKALTDDVKAVVSRGGRPDMAMSIIPRVKSPTLLIVGGNDYGVIELNQSAFEALSCKKELAIIPGASHLFIEPGTLLQVANKASEWFSKYLV